MNPNIAQLKDKDFSLGRKYIGASDAPTLALANDYQTPYEFWEVYTGRKEGFKGNARSAAGHEQEPVILGEYIRRKFLDDMNLIKEHSDSDLKDAAEYVREFIVSRLWDEQNFNGYHSYTEAVSTLNNRHCAHADMLDLTGDIPIIVQAKNTGQFASDIRKRNPLKGYSKDDLSQNGIPLSVFFQEQWEMYCYEIPSAYVAVQIDGWDKRIYGKIEYHKKTVERLVTVADRMLWCIDNDRPPAPNSWGDILSMFPEQEKGTKVALSGQDEKDALVMRSQLGKISSHIKTLESRKTDICMGLSMFTGDIKTGSIKQYLTTSDGQKICSFGTKTGQMRASYRKIADNPELLEQCELIGAISQDDDSKQIYVSGAPAGSVQLYTAITYPEGKRKPSHKKYTAAEKKDITAFSKNAGIRLEWETYSN